MISESVITAGKDGPSLRAALASGAQRLSRAGGDTARLDAEVLLGHVLALPRERLILSSNGRMNREQLARYEEALRRRLEGEPVAYITGRQEFWSLEFCVTPDVLIPRPETERLVEIALVQAGGENGTGTMRVLDVGTGSGAVAISLAKELDAAELWATDVSTMALAIASSNAAYNGVGERVRFLCGDLFTPVAAEAEKFAVIVSNPPYIRSSEIAGLAPEVSCWEPRLALDGGADGLDFYRRIAAEAWSRLIPDGAVALEIGAGMGAAVVRLFNDTGRYARAQTFFDYAGRDRVVVAHAREQSASASDGGR